MKHQWIKHMIMCTVTAGLFACSGSSSSTGGSSTTGARNLTGNASGSSTPALVNELNQTLSESGCLADTIIATTTTGTTSTATLDSNCDFNLELQTGQSYVISFVLDGQFVASLLFDTGISGFGDSVFSVDDSTGDINLGAITFSGNLASSEHNPLEYCDSDDDGIHDFDDDDDDGDDIYDYYESDCDLDGYIDDYDDDSCSSSDSNLVRVKPSEDDDEVDLDKDVKVKTACVIDESTVTAESFAVVSEDESHVVACTYSIHSDESQGDTIKCEHDADPFLADTVYTVTLTGITCDDSSALGDGTWSFLTESEDDDEGDYEDQWDDEDELDDDSSDSSDDSFDNSEDDSEDDSESEDDSNEDSEDDTEDDSDEDSLDD